MRKAEKIQLEKELYGLGLSQCEIHKLPLVYHVLDFFKGTSFEGTEVEGCWDCPVDGCDHHIHEAPGKPWTNSQ